jgi:hypothetical protein
LARIGLEAGSDRQRVRRLRLPEFGANDLTQRAMEPLRRPFQDQLPAGDGCGSGFRKLKDGASHTSRARVPEGEDDLLAA